jgi:predicted solute-binding protein
MTGLPMVFAVWAARAEVPRRIPSRSSNRCASDSIISTTSRAPSTPRWAFQRTLARSYLKDNIVFELGDREYAGLKTFLQYASELGNPVKGRKVSA